MLRRLFILSLWAVWIVTTAYFAWKGSGYYGLGLSERPLSPDHANLRPSGPVGHGLGIAGSLLMIVGVAMYSVRKRVRRAGEWGHIRDWLAVHIFLCVMGARLVTFHTAMKFGGLVSISYWSMVGVLLSGFLGRYVYVRIPRDDLGNETALADLEDEVDRLESELRSRYVLSPSVLKALDSIAHRAAARQSDHLGRMILADFTRLMTRRRIGRALAAEKSLPKYVRRRVAQLAARQSALSRNLRFLSLSKRILHYWHVIHLPFTLVMFLIMFIHVGAAILFGYTWVL